MVTVFCPLTTTGPGVTAAQLLNNPMFVLDCNENAAALVGHCKTTLVSEGLTTRCGIFTPRTTVRVVFPTLLTVLVNEIVSL